jgi:PAS domain S-box-containing protein
MWVSKQERDLLELLIRNCDMPILFTGAEGAIFWANAACEEFIGYTSWELTTGTSGKGVGWDRLFVSGENLEADREMSKQCAKGERHKYSIKTQCLPKNEKPIWVELNVLRYPVVGDLQCFIVLINPLKNGNQAAFAMNMERLKEFSEELRKIQERHQQMENNIISGVKNVYAERSETEQIFLSTARLVNRNPKVSGIICLVILIMILGTQLVQAIETTKKLIGW